MHKTKIKFGWGIHQLFKYWGVSAATNILHRFFILISIYSDMKMNCKQSEVINYDAAQLN